MEIETAKAASTALRTLAHPTRLNILRKLLEGSCRREDFTGFATTDPNKIGAHLERLRFESFIITKRNYGRTYYELADDRTKRLVQWIDGTFFKSIDCN